MTYAVSMTAPGLMTGRDRRQAQEFLRELSARIDSGELTLSTFDVIKPLDETPGTFMVMFRVRDSTSYPRPDEYRSRMSENRSSPVEPEKPKPRPHGAREIDLD